jgi:methionine synthase II (cobalamin-independent)
VVGFSAEGTVSAEDYTKVLMPAVEEALTKHDKLRLLYVAGPEFRRYDLSAMWDDTVFGVEHFLDFERIAFVSDHEMMNAVVRGFSPMMPAAVRVFPMADLAKAKAWLTR